MNRLPLHINNRADPFIFRRKKFSLTWTLPYFLYVVHRYLSWLYAMMYLVTYWLASFRPWVATLTILIGRRRSTCSHWRRLLRLEDQPPLYRPRGLIWSLARQAAWYLSHMLDAVIAPFGMRLLERPQGLTVGIRAVSSKGKDVNNWQVMWEKYDSRF